MSALQLEIIDFIRVLPDSTLETLKPLIYKLSQDEIFVERVTFDELSEDEQQSVIRGRKELARGECIDFEDYLASRA
ncbi:hypothetical protein FACS189425_08210 [Clostridia bacterium]|nr:hypothetical protein FACS189425_08210 [Clostridia bacterium]